MRGPRLTVLAVVAGLVAAPVPAQARPEAVPRTTPNKAEANREMARQGATSDLSAGNHGRAADLLEDAGRQFGDPMLFMEAADACLQGAEQERDVVLAERAKADALIALDILEFHRSARTRWQVVDPSAVSLLADRANGQIRSADDLIDQIGSADFANEADSSRRRGGAKGLLIGGSALIGVGVVGAALAATGVGLGAARQKDVDALDPNDPTFDQQYSDLDAKGKNANIIAYAGAAVGAIGLAVGIALVVIAKKRQREGGTDSKTARALVVPLARGAAVVARF